MLSCSFMPKPKALVYFSDTASSVGERNYFLSPYKSNKKDIKGHRWMPWLVEAMKDVLGCDKPRGAAKKL